MAFKAFTSLFGSKKPKIEPTPDYQRWREVVFAAEPEQVGVSKSETDRVYGVIMDIGLRDQQNASPWAISLSAFLSGEASFRPTPGGGVIGLGSNVQVAQVAQEIIEVAQTLHHETKPAQDHSLPEPGTVQFFFLTPGGVRIFKGPLAQLQQPDNPFRRLLNGFGFIRDFADQLRKDE